MYVTVHVYDNADHWRNVDYVSSGLYRVLSDVNASREHLLSFGYPLVIAGMDFSDLLFSLAASLQRSTKSFSGSLAYCNFECGRLIHSHSYVLPAGGLA